MTVRPRSPRSPFPVPYALLVLLLAVPAFRAAAQKPQDAVDALLAADRKYAAAAAKLDVADAISAMLADSIFIPLPNGTFARTREEARTSLAANPVNKGAHVTWHPVRAVLSADGLQGFTAGYMTLTSDTLALPLKYISYWIRGKDGWRVTAYKRGRAGGEAPAAMLPNLLPTAIVAPASAREQAAHMQSLIAAEKHFSDSSQKVGLGPAFAVFGRDDAINMGGPAPAFVVGAAEISKVVGGGPPGAPSPVNWNADFAFVSTSGDLGVTFGYIRRNDPAAAGPPSPFFTIWSRPGGKGEWRYIAE